MNDESALHDDGHYDEALTRFHATGPEFDGALSNHGPMVIEALARAGRGEVVHRWTDTYLRRLDELPRGLHPVADDTWREALGDPARTGDWIAYLLADVASRPWRETLAVWWPRLLPGVAAGATHGVIRTGHVVAALEQRQTEPRLTELAHALGYWAARWQPVPGVELAGPRDPAEVLREVPAVPDQRGGVRARLAQLDEGFVDAASTVTAGDDPRDQLARVVHAAVTFYADHGHGQPTMLVHAATAPNAVARALPSLPRSMWPMSLGAAWTASAAVVAAYRPSTTRPATTAGADPQDLVDAAARHGGEHVLKLVDTVLEVHRRTGDPRALAAGWSAIALDA